MIKHLNLEYINFIKKIINKITSVRIDSYINDPESLQAAIQLAETPFGRNRMKRILLMSQGIPRREINALVPLAAPTGGTDSRTAAFENDMFMTSAENTFVEHDDHIIHMDSHQLRADKVKQKVQEGAIELKAAFSWLANALPHMERHMKALDDDPTLSHDRYQDKHKANIQFLAQVRTELERQAKAQAQQAQQAGGPDEQKHQAEIRRDDEKAAAKQRNLALANESRAVEHQRSSDFNRFLKKQEHDQKMQMEAEKANQDQSISAAKKIAE